MSLVATNCGEVTGCSSQGIRESSVRCNCAETSKDTGSFKWALPTDTRSLSSTHGARARPEGDPTGPVTCAQGQVHEQQQGCRTAGWTFVTSEVLEEPSQ